MLSDACPEQLVSCLPLMELFTVPLPASDVIIVFLAGRVMQKKLMSFKHPLLLPEANPRRRLLVEKGFSRIY
jgi:hypothetical protein